MSKVEGRNLKSVLDVRSARGVESRRKKTCLSVCVREEEGGGRGPEGPGLVIQYVWSWQWENPKPPGSSIYRADGLNKPASLRKERKEKEERSRGRWGRGFIYIPFREGVWRR